MSSTSNKLSQSNKLLAEKPINEANRIQGEVLKINGKCIEKVCIFIEVINICV